MMDKRVFAVVAHPDDIEFGMAGTLILLGNVGYEPHYMTIANGSCGSVEHDAQTIASVREKEARNACSRIGAVYHPPLVNDIDIFYEKALLAKVGSVMREVDPQILLVPSPSDYMEDHMIACRLAISAAFCRNMRNFPVDPPRDPVETQLTAYHAQPLANWDYLKHPVKPDFFVNVTEVLDEKIAMLAEHKSQKEWLDRSQRMDAYLEHARQHARKTGTMSGQFKFAEGWRRHHPLGLCDPEADPLCKALGGRIHTS